MRQSWGQALAVFGQIIQKYLVFELFVLLDYFTRKMFHKPGLSKISNFLWSTLSLEHIVSLWGEGWRTAVPGSRMFLSLFFFSPGRVHPSCSFIIQTLQLLPGQTHKHLSVLSLLCLSLYVYLGKCFGYFKVRLMRFIFTEQYRRAPLPILTFT